MTTEKLKQEAEEKANAFCKENKLIAGSEILRFGSAFERGYLASAEPREKQIAELKAQLESERDLPVIAYMQGAEKQKKKDEEELKKWKDEWQEQVQKATDEGYARTLQTMQLTKAKELLNEFMRISKASDEDFEHDYSELIGEAEQFLNIEVEK